MQKKWRRAGPTKGLTKRADQLSYYGYWLIERSLVVAANRRVMAHGVRADGVVRDAGAGGAGGGGPALQLAHRAHARR
ncbi:jg17779 [Pararge aegeria aegeria]|uniref:Jg17779 protein n=1 Tax=Pararge aegeria aegeria TaxID=348720 RepID=A0A8S4R8C1_9NEOP|nr:jg17779 [Pararge aegeria aegeria]